MSKNEMNFGLFFLNSLVPWKTDAEELRDGLEQIKIADELGFESAWVAEHNARSYGVVTSSSVYLAAAAAQTKNIKLATAVARLPLHHPLQLAEELALVDIVSDGRLYIGVGKGYDKFEFDAYNIDFDERVERYNESLDMLKAALQNGKVSYSGNIYNVEDIPVYPSPVQKPMPKLFVMVSQNDSSIINAAKQGHAFILGGITNEDTMHKINLYKEKAIECGYSQEFVDDSLYHSGKLLFLHVAETDEKAQEEYKKGLEWYMSERDSRPTFGVVTRERGLSYEKFLQSENTMIGSPETVTEKIKQFKEETGLSKIICWMNIGGQPQDQVLNSMRLFSEQVMPNFK